MSTGLDCQFREAKPGEWYYDLEHWSYRDVYDTFGPFKTFAEANAHLRAHHANPGGYSIDAHPDSTDRSWQ